jgi:glutamine synthetase type III
MLALEFERLGREVEAGPQIIAFQIGKLLQEILERVASGQIFEQGGSCVCVRFQGQ